MENTWKDVYKRQPEQGIPIYGPEGEWEFCTTINDSWGYRPSDNDYKTSGQIIRMFCDCITLGGRLLLDVGPKEDGLSLIHIWYVST